MEILTREIEDKIKNVINYVLQKNCDLDINHISNALNDLQANIPEGKRVSYRRVHAIKVLSEYLHSQFVEINAPVCQIASLLFEKGGDYGSRGVSLGMLSFYGHTNYVRVLPHFESAAASSDWNMRELAQMFFRKLLQRHPNELKEYLLKLARSEDAEIRRFVSETLRPVRENGWFFENPDYPLSILRTMFKESSPYPRTSMGNNLSDFSRRLPDLVYDVVQELVNSGDDNSYWIAYRACRNLVKKDPIKVMDLLKVNRYIYKKRVFRRSDYQRN